MTDKEIADLFERVQEASPGCVIVTRAEINALPDDGQRRKMGFEAGVGAFFLGFISMLLCPFSDAAIRMMLPVGIGILVGYALGRCAQRGR